MRQVTGLGLGALVVGFWATPGLAQRLGVLAYLEAGGPRENRGAAVTLSLDLDRAFTRRELGQLETSASGASPDPGDPLAGETELPVGGVGSGLMPAGEVTELRQEWFDALAQAEAPAASATPATSTAGALKEGPFLFEWSDSFLRQLILECVALQTRSLDLYEAAGVRARYAALLPDLVLRFGRNTDRSLRLTPTQSEPDRYQLSGGYDYKLEAQASWDLSRVVFSEHEVSLGRLRHWVSGAQREVTKQALTAALRWQKAEVSLAGGGLLPEERLQFTLERAAAEGELNVLSGGWFLRHRREAWRR